MLFVFLVCQLIRNHNYSHSWKEACLGCSPSQQQRCPVIPMLYFFGWYPADFVEHSVGFGFFYFYLNVFQCLIQVSRLQVIQSPKINSFPMARFSHKQRRLNLSWHLLVAGLTFPPSRAAPAWCQKPWAWGAGSSALYSCRRRPCQSCAPPEDVPNTLQAQMKQFGSYHETKMSVTLFSFPVTNWFDGV